MSEKYKNLEAVLSGYKKIAQDEESGLNELEDKVRLQMDDIDARDRVIESLDREKMVLENALR